MTIVAKAMGIVRCDHYVRWCRLHRGYAKGSMQSAVAGRLSEEPDKPEAKTGRAARDRHPKVAPMGKYYEVSYPHPR